MISVCKNVTYIFVPNQHFYTRISYVLNEKNVLFDK